MRDVKLLCVRYTIPKGAVVYFATYLMHRDPTYWERPLEFLVKQQPS